MSPRLFLCAAVAAFYGAQSCGGFNIDVQFPVVKEGKTPGSLFGFSVALHSQSKGSDNYLLLVGAPKEKANSLPNVNETGAVYFCPVSTDPTDCTRMDLVTSTNPSEMVEGMWLGVTVASQRSLKEGRVLACGHRYVKIAPGQQRRMIGKCYVRGNDLLFDDSDEWQNDIYERCNPGFDHLNEGMCNLGISGGLTETDIFLGASGSFSWKGNVHITWRDPDPLNSWDINNKQIGELKKKSSYIGYSILEERKLLSQTSYTVVTGAPRDESKGSVMLGRVQKEKPIEIVQTFLGEQVGSFFGNSLAATDLNNDNWNDLIVGAPFYFDREEDKGGAVYIFMNENGSFQSTCTTMLKGESFSGFGMAVSAIGDVNQDGFQDFAVGAPFEKESGKLYIWMGSKKGFSQEPSQEIEGKSVGNGNFQTFGYSISGGMDLDSNGYPDILVGSLDDRIALLRARPVIHLTKNFTAEPKIVDPQQCPEDIQCISVTVCLSFTLSNGNKDFRKPINVDYVLEAEPDRRDPRVKFQNDASTYAATLKLLSSQTTCDTLKLSVVKSVRDKLEPVVFSLNLALPEQKKKTKSSLQNLDFFPILSKGQKLTQRTEINFQKACGEDNKCTSNLQMSAVFADENSIPFTRDENLNAQVLQFDKNLKKIKLLVVVTNNKAPGKDAEDAHQTTLSISIPKELPFSAVRPNNTVIDIDSDGKLTCELGNPIKREEKVELQILFETSGISLYTESIKIEMLLSTLSEQSDLRPLAVVLKIKSVIEPFFSIEHPPKLTKFGGTVKGEYAMRQTSDVGSLVELTLKVNMNGKPLGDMGNLDVEFEWPYEVANGKWLLYLTKVVVKGQSEMECIPGGGVINPLKLTLSGNTSTHGRSKRQAEERDVEETIQAHTVEPQPAITLYTTRKSYLLDCSKETAKCVKFTCRLLNMSNSAEIHIRSRLWNGTMLEDYSNAARVTVKGGATLKLNTDKPTIKMEPQPLIFTVDIEPEENVEIPYKLPLWIIISAAVAGVVLLGIIILILWKCGFFQRASRREMYEAKAQKAEMKVQPSDTEKMIEDY